MAEYLNILKTKLKRRVIQAFARMGYSLRRLQPDDMRYLGSSHDPDSPLPNDAADALRIDHPRLEELRQAYAALDLPVTQRHTVWNADRLSRELNLPWFRGDNAYVWQYRQLHSDIRLKQYLMLRYTESVDDLGLLERLEEDGAFGCWTFRYGQRPPVSRDLLESIIEINYLHHQLGIADTADLKVLDIGAGYGRLAHRMCEALSNLQRYDCVDAIAESTYLCEYYLAHRGVDERAHAVPLHQLDRLAEPGEYNLAVNIHSFSECPRAAIRWWLELLVQLRVPYLLIVPNDPDQMLSFESQDRREDFSPDLTAAGFELIHKQPVYDSEEMFDLINVRDHFFLYRQSRV